jgi:hypothetical protein
MYRFDDKWRKRLLEDALVAELLGGVGEVSSARGSVSVEKSRSPASAATTEGRARVAKSNV